MLGERVETRDAASEPRLRALAQKRGGAIRRRSARPEEEEGRGCRVTCVQNHAPLAPRAGGADYGPAHTHHSRNQAGVRGSGSCGISPAWCVHVLIETYRD